MTEKLLIIQVVIRSDVENNLENLEELSSRLHGRPQVKVNWFPTPDVFTSKPELVDRVIDYCNVFGDEFTFDLGCPCTGNDQKTINAAIDECMAHMKRLTGGYPISVGSWHINAPSVRYLREVYGVEVVVGQMWEQLGVDGFTGVGSINGPYYPSASHSMVPARQEGSRLDVILLDTIASDPYDTKYPKTARGTIHPWDSQITAGDGVAFQKHIAHSYFDLNSVRNDFMVVNFRFELDWMNQTHYCYNKHREMKKRLFEFWDGFAKDHQDVRCATLREFNSLFRSKHKNNDGILYRYHHKSKYDPNVFIYWYFNRSHAIAVEYRVANHDSGETIVLDNLDFRKEGAWRDGYDTAEYDPAAYPETRVRTTPVENDIDAARIMVKGGWYDTWILSDGTSAGSIEVMIGGRSLGIASGTRGVDGWCKLGGIELLPGEHCVEVIHRYNPEGQWYATYGQVLLTQEMEYRPARNRLLRRHGFVAVTNYVAYNDDLIESRPPAADWSVINGTNWRIEGVMRERLVLGDRCLDTHSQEGIYRNAKISSSDHGVGVLTLEENTMIPFEVELINFEETSDSATFTFRFFNQEEDLLEKTITITKTSLIFEYDYKRQFDWLELQDAFGKTQVLACPWQITFQDGCIARIESHQPAVSPSVLEEGGSDMVVV